MSIVIVISLLILVAGSATQPEVPKDFALRLEGGVCTTDVVDTFKGIYVRDLGTGKTLSAPVRLSAAQTKKLYRLVTDIRFFDYPSQFRPKGGIAVEPSPTYRLEVRSAGASHSVSWNDLRQSTPEAQRLRNLLDSTWKVFRDLPAVRRLPTQEILCL